MLTVEYCDLSSISDTSPRLLALLAMEATKEAPADLAMPRAKMVIE
jgi:hypothetical protein